MSMDNSKQSFLTTISELVNTDNKVKGTGGNLSGKEKVHVELQDNKGYTGFMNACFRGHLHYIEFLHSLDVNTQIENLRGDNAFSIACYGNRYKVVEYFFQNNIATPNHQNVTGLDTPLLDTVKNRNYKMCHVCLAYQNLIKKFN